MPSKLPKVNFVLSEDELIMVRQYQEENGIRSLSKAFVELISKGLNNENQRIAEQESAKKEQPADDDELSEVETQLFTEFRALPASHKGLAASLCVALIRELVKHQTVELETEASVPAGLGR